MVTTAVSDSIRKIITRACCANRARVDLDAEWNEYIDLRIAAGAPRPSTSSAAAACHGNSGWFQDRKVSAGQLTIGQGRIYVDGYLAENHGANRAFNPTLEEKYGTAPLPVERPALRRRAGERAGASARSCIWMSGAARSTHLQEPGLIEPAVNVDTTTRYQTAWQVKLLGNIAAAVTCRTPLTESPIGRRPICLRRRA